jgi:hypothetical protein
MYKMHSRNYKTPKIMNMRRHRNKWTQRGMQQTPKWNKAHYKKEIYELKMITQNIRGVEQR